MPSSPSLRPSRTAPCRPIAGRPSRSELSARQSSAPWSPSSGPRSRRSGLSTFAPPPTCRAHVGCTRGAGLDPAPVRRPRAGRRGAGGRRRGGPARDRRGRRGRRCDDPPGGRARQPRRAESGAPEAGSPKLLAASVGGVSFPDYAEAFGLRARGTPSPTGSTAARPRRSSTRATAASLRTRSSPASSSHGLTARGSSSARASSCGCSTATASRG